MRGREVGKNEKKIEERRRRLKEESGKERPRDKRERVKR